MKLENQVCSIEQAEKLKELGVKQESLFYWTHSEKWGIMPKKSIDFSGNPTSVFTASELIQMNISFGGIEYSDKNHKFYMQTSFEPKEFTYYDTFSQALAYRLISAIENGWTTIEEVNERLLEG